MKRYYVKRNPLGQWTIYRRTEEKGEYARDSQVETFPSKAEAEEIAKLYNDDMRDK